MAMIDYGALVIKNGIPVNKNRGMFLECPDYFDEDVKDNYFAYCGDEEYSLCFYKCSITETKNGNAVDNFWNFPFKSETFYRDNGVNITVRRLDDLLPVYATNLQDYETWEDYVKENWSGATGLEKDSELENGQKYHKLWKKNCKRIGRRKVLYYKSTNKYIATWEYKGDKWEVIFGYGIDPDEDVFNDITGKGRYNYTENGIKYIREKFFEVNDEK